MIHSGNTYWSCMYFVVSQDQFAHGKLCIPLKDDPGTCLEILDCIYPCNQLIDGRWVVGGQVKQEALEGIQDVMGIYDFHEAIAAFLESDYHGNTIIGPIDEPEKVLERFTELNYVDKYEQDGVIYEQPKFNKWGGVF